MLNQVSLIGRVNYVYSNRTFESGAQIIQFSIAFTDYSGGKQQTHYVKCEAWGKIAQNISKYAPVGTQIGISGKLLSSIWKDDAGTSRSSMFVRVSSLELLASPKQQASLEQDLAEAVQDETLPF